MVGFHGGKDRFLPLCRGTKGYEQERDKNTDFHLFKILYTPTGRGSIFLQQFQYHFGCFFQTFLPVVAVDNGKDMAGFKFHLGALVVAGRGTDTAYTVAVDGQPFYVQHATAYTLERFLGTSYAQLKVASLYLVGIKSADRVART